MGDGVDETVHSIVSSSAIAPCTTRSDNARHLTPTTFQLVILKNSRRATQESQVRAITKPPNRESRSVLRGIQQRKQWTVWCMTSKAVFVFRFRLARGHGLGCGDGLVFGPGLGFGFGLGLGHDQFGAHNHTTPPPPFLSPHTYHGVQLSLAPPMCAVWQ